MPSVFLNRTVHRKYFPIPQNWFSDAFLMAITSPILARFRREVIPYICLKLLFEVLYTPTQNFSKTRNCFNASHIWLSTCHCCVSRPDDWYFQKSFRTINLKFTILDGKNASYFSFQNVSCPLLNINFITPKSPVKVFITSKEFMFPQNASISASTKKLVIDSCSDALNIPWLPVSVLKPDIGLRQSLW